MLLPNKIVAPSNSLLFLASGILEILISHEKKLDDIVFEIQDKYAANTENVILALDFLYIIGKVEIENEAIKIIL